MAFRRSSMPFFPQEEPELLEGEATTAGHQCLHLLLQTLTFGRQILAHSKQQEGWKCMGYMKYPVVDIGGNILMKHDEKPWSGSQLRSSCVKSSDSPVILRGCCQPTVHLSASTRSLKPKTWWNFSRYSKILSTVRSMRTLGVTATKKCKNCGLKTREQCDFEVLYTTTTTKIAKTANSADPNQPPRTW